jgi:hypothetical protein
LVVLAGRGDELNPAAALALDTTQVLALAANDESNQARLNLDRLDVVVLATQRRPIPTTTVGTARREALATASRRVGALAPVTTILRAMLSTPLIPVRVEVVAI